MDKFIEQPNQDCPTKNNEENINLNNNEFIDNNYDSAPPLIPAIPESQEKPITPQEGTVEPFYPDTKKDNYYSNNNENLQNYQNNRNRRIRQRKKSYRKASKCRKVFQIIACIVLYILVLVSISFQIFDYGINLAMIDDICITALATYMLILTLKGYSTGECKIGCISLLIAFVGFGVRGGGAAIVKGNIFVYIIIFIIRTLILLFVTTYNCNPGEETVIYI